MFRGILSFPDILTLNRGLIIKIIHEIGYFASVVI